MANVLDEAKAARGAVGPIGKVEIVWNFHGPRWRGRPEVKRIREEDTDWRKWFLDKPYRPPAASPANG